MILTCRQMVSGGWRLFACAVCAGLLLASAPASALVFPSRQIWQHRTCNENRTAEFMVRTPGFLELDVMHTTLRLGRLDVRELSKPEDSNLVWQWHPPEHWNMGIQWRARSPHLSPGRYTAHWQETGQSAACYTSLALRG